MTSVSIEDLNLFTVHRGKWRNRKTHQSLLKNLKSRQRGKRETKREREIPRARFKKIKTQTERIQV